MLVEREVSERESRQISSRLRRAKLKQAAVAEDVQGGALTSVCVYRRAPSLLGLSQIWVIAVEVGLHLHAAALVDDRRLITEQA